MLTQEQYLIERAICDKAQAYWEANATFDRDGGSSMVADLCAHPDYAACDNAMRSRIEQFETLRDLPDHLSVYMKRTELNGWIATTWTGDFLGTAVCTSTWKTPQSFVSSTMSSFRVTIGGKVYLGRSAGDGMYCNLKAKKSAP